MFILSKLENKHVIRHIISHCTSTYNIHIYIYYKHHYTILLDMILLVHWDCTCICDTLLILICLDNKGFPTVLYKGPTVPGGHSQRSRVAGGGRCQLLAAGRRCQQATGRMTADTWCLGVLLCVVQKRM
jgi:hypothetical protein